MTPTRRPRRRPSVLAPLLPALVLVAVVVTGSGGSVGASRVAPVVDLRVTSASR